jgi:hypothetical protein
MCKLRQHVRASQKSTNLSNQVTQLFFLDDNVLQFGDINMSRSPFGTISLPVGDHSMTLDNYHKNHRITAHSSQRRETTHIIVIPNVRPEGISILLFSECQIPHETLPQAPCYPQNFFRAPLFQTATPSERIHPVQALCTGNSPCQGDARDRH